MSGTHAAAATPDLAMSAEISPLLQGIQLQGVDEMIQQRFNFNGLTMEEKAVMVVGILGEQAQQAEVTGSLVDHLWTMHVVPQKLWEYYDGGEDKFLQDVDFARFVKPALDSAERTRKRKAHELGRIQPAWGPGWEKVIESSNPLSILSQNYLGHMAYLASNGIRLVDATKLLHWARAIRLSNPHRGVPTSEFVTVGDALKVTDAFKRLCRSRGISPSQCTTEDLLSSLQVASTGTAIPRISELESPAATPISHPSAGLPAAHIPGIALQVPPQIHSPNETEQKLAIFTISAGANLACGTYKT